MSCAVCNRSLGSTYVVLNGYNVHKACETSIKFCDDCRTKSILNGRCLVCTNVSRYTCNGCGKNIKNGQIYYGHLKCFKCITREETKKRDYVDECYKNNICYKCGGPIKTITEIRCFGITGGGEHEVDVTLCNKCGVLK
jgi:hypothetical protein